MRMNIDHVQLAAPVGCEDAARSFFTGILDFNERPKFGAPAKRGGVWFEVGRLELHVGVVANFMPAKKAHVAFCLDAVSALEMLGERLEADDYPVVWNDGLPGIRRFFSTDPWGNRLEFMAYENV